MTGLVVDWQEYDTLYTDAGLIPPKDHVPATEEFMLYDADSQRVGYATSFMYSPMLQRHIAIARVRPDLATPGTRVDLEVTVNHRYERVGARVTRMPLYNPAHKTA
jgi:aminomethyltransferase